LRLLQQALAGIQQLGLQQQQQQQQLRQGVSTQLSAVSEAPVTSSMCRVAACTQTCPNPLLENLCIKHGFA
jgi:hypothetical protein